METLGERLKFIQKHSGKTQADLAESLGISKGSLILYQKNKRRPDSSLLQSFCQRYKVNPNWLLLGMGEPFDLEADTMVAKAALIAQGDPVEQLLAEEEERAAVCLSSGQRTAILKIFRELVSRDVRAIRELLQAITREQQHGQE